MFRKAEWIDFQPGVSDRPECEVVGQDGENKLYAFRGSYRGALTPGKADRDAYIGYADKEIKLTSGQLLRRGNYDWIFGSFGSVPWNAVPMGHAGNGYPFYMGRAFYKDTLLPGKIYPQHQCLYITYQGSEHFVKTYTVLCYKYDDCPSPSCPNPATPPCPEQPITSCHKPPVQHSCDDDSD